MNSINFKANFLTNVTVKKKSANNKFLPSQVSLVEIDPKNKMDIKALKYTANKWKNNVFCRNILFFAKQNKTYNYNFYAITSQDNNFEALAPKKLLGLAVTDKKNDKTRLVRIEAINPATNHSDYKGVGSALIKYFQQQFNYIELFCPSFETINKFYFPLKFKSKSPSAKNINEFGELEWQNRIFGLKNRLKSIKNYTQSLFSR